jgi:hypothetical protein
MHLSLVLISLIGLCNPARSASQYVDVDVNLIQRPNGDMQSAAFAICFDFFHEYDPSCQMTGAHEIRDASSNLLLGSRDIFSFGEYNNYVARTPRPGHCYRARISAQKVGYPSTLKALGSQQECAEAAPGPDFPRDGCPILLDLDLNGFHLTGLDVPVRFDLDADGIEEETAWTAAGSGDAFLCWDRNGNGSIDDGRELFGQATVMRDGGRAETGYIPLGQLDHPDLGGNLDGFIGAEDSIYDLLCVWTDTDRDGVSQPEEIQSLQAAGVLRIGYEDEEGRRQDVHGNLFRYRSKTLVLNPAGKPRAGVSYDVYFSTR